MCHECSTKPVYEFTNKRKVCARCFIRYFQKKVFYINRKFELIKRGDVVGYKNSGNFRDVVLEDVLRFFSERAGVEIIDTIKSKKYNKLAVSDTINVNSDKIIETIFNKNLSKIKNINPAEKNTINPLYLFTDEEVLLYAKLRGLKFKVNKKNDKNNLIKFVDALEKKHPELRRAIVSGWLGLENK